jgi:hypothetical protein
LPVSALPLLSLPDGLSGVYRAGSPLIQQTVMKPTRRLKVKLKTHLLPILFLLLLTPVSYGQTPPESPNAQDSGLGIEPEQLYPGLLILELIEIAEAEIDEAVQEAFAEGYKAAMLQYAPEAAAYKQDVESLRLELEREQKRNSYFLPAVSISAGLSFVAGILVNSFITR